MTVNSKKFISAIILSALLLGLTNSAVAQIDCEYLREEASNGTPANAKIFPNGPPLLAVAASLGCNGAIIIFFDHGANLNYQDKNGATALMAAAQNRQVKTIEMLLRKKADPNLKSLTGITALDMAKHVGCDECAQLLEEYKEKKGDDTLYSSLVRKVLLKGKRTLHRFVKKLRFA
jgi:hypothetical protein